MLACKPLRGTVGDMTERRITPPMLKEIRSKLGITQTEAAERCRVGLRTWMRWEQGTREPDGPASIVIELLAAEANSKPATV